MNEYTGSENFLIAFFVNLAAALVMLGMYKFFLDDRRSLVARVLTAWGFLSLIYIIDATGIYDLDHYVSYTGLIGFLVILTGFIMGHKIHLQQDELKYHKTYLRETNREKDFEEFQTFAKRVGVGNTSWNS